MAGDRYRSACWSELLRERSSATSDRFTGDATERSRNLVAKLFDVPRTIVAAIRGNAVDGGFGLALAADFGVCTLSSRFGENFANLGFRDGFGLGGHVTACRWA
jgi:enoyl-CoA hydratase/carnithine racemase